MPFAAALSTQPQTAQALAEVCAQVRASLPDTPDLAVLFFSGHHAEDAALLGRGVREQFQPRCLIGCIGESIIGNDQEVERTPAVSLWAAKFAAPVTLEPFHLALERTS